MPMDPTDSSIFELASVGSYLDALSSITDEMTLRERSNLIFLDKCLHAQWRLGQNVLLNWCPDNDGISLLVVPHYAVASYAQQHGNNDTHSMSEEDLAGPSEDFFKSLLSSPRQLDSKQMDKVARILGIEKSFLQLRDSISASKSHCLIVERMIKRYSISYVSDRAVALFDIVGFSLLSPFEQMTQLNSLSYSLNSAQSKLLSKKIGINFARSTTGDGFYIWNRDLSLDANINLYHFMHLVLADNAIANSKAEKNTVPPLRACFHVGSSYEFHQAEGLNPTIYNYIVGDVTVELARMIDHALPGQILVGEFNANLHTLVDGESRSVDLNTIDFVQRATESLAQLTGLELAGDRVDVIKCYLTGSRLVDGEFTVRRLIVSDKHGLSRTVYNAKVNIYRQNAQPILLGIEDGVLGTTKAVSDHSGHIVRSLGT